jgi:periplasmic protein TonB
MRALRRTSVGNPSNRPARLSRRLAAIVALSIVLSVSTASAEELKPITRETPAYPYGALARGVEGSGLLEYTVDERGRVVAPRVIHATPPGVFDRAALNALSRWRYEPNGSAPTTMKVKLTFRR